MKLTPEIVRELVRKFGYVSNSQAGDIEYALSLLVNSEADNVMDAIAKTKKEFGEENDC